MESKTGLREAAQFAAMFIVECEEVGMVTLAKTVIDTRISPLVFLVYYNSLGVVFFSPFFIFRSYRKKQSPLTLTLLCRFFILGLFGSASLMFGFVGLKYSSPAMAAFLANIVPVFTFLLAIIFRMEKIDLRSSSSIAKSLGTIVAVSGAFMVTLYKGPAIMSGASHSSLHSQDFVPEGSNWALGGLLLAIGFCSAATWNILQAATVKQYPEKTTVVFFFMLFGTLQCAAVSFIVERNPSAWTLPSDIVLFCTVRSAAYGVVLRYSVITWCLHEKGPLYVAMFKPLGMIFAVVAGVIFFDDELHLGSVIGSIIIGLGFYTVMWGQTKEKKTMPVDWGHQDRV